MRPARTLFRTAVLATALAVPVAASAQETESARAYLQSVAEYFRVSLEEVLILQEWHLSPEEIPVLLFLSARTGVSPDALAALRHGGASWSELGRRYEVGSGAFHVPLANDVSAGILSRAYEQFRSRPSSQWDSISLDDGEVVGLVNVRVLSEILDVRPEGVLDARSRSGSFVGAFDRLVRRAR